MKAKIARITDILRRDDGISGAMHYTEQISWVLFLKFLNDYEQNKADEAAIKYGSYEYIINEEHRWDKWACPKDEKGKLDLKGAKTGGDLINYVNKELFPYLKNFKNLTQDPKSIKYKVGAIFEYLDNRIANGHTLREVLDIVDSLNFQSKDDLFELSEVYENLLQGMGSDGGNSGEFYTPRPVIKAMVKALDPKVGQTVYDGALGSGGFLVEAFEHMREQKNITAKDWDFLQNDTFFGKEKTPLAYVMGVMNMILHGVENPNIYKQNTLASNIRDIQEKDRFDIILANPPFGGKERPQIQQNFPIKTNATELLFLQHFMKSLKVNGKAAIIVPEGVLFQTNNAFKQVKKELLENFNLHTIVSLPEGVFLPYSGVKTNIIFFDRTGATSHIWYYEVKPPYKLTKNKTILFKHFEEFFELFSRKEKMANSWIKKIEEIKNYNISAKNPDEKEHEKQLDPIKLIREIKKDEQKIKELIDELEKNNKAKITQTFFKNWEFIRLEEVLIRTQKIDPKVSLKSEFDYVDISSIDRDKLEITSPKRLTPKESPSRARQELKVDDVLFATTRPTLKNIAIVGENLITPIGSTGFCVLRANVEKIIGKYLFYIITSDFIQESIKNFIRGAQYPAISNKDLLNVKIPVPPLSEQKDIVKKIDEVFKKIEELKKLSDGRYKNLLSLKKSIINEALRGKL